jgi:hypothetical protein
MKEKDIFIFLILFLVKSDNIIVKCANYEIGIKKD